jgi:hypothetical protein
VVERGGLARCLAAERQEATENLPAVPSHTDLRPIPARSRRDVHISFAFHFYILHHKKEFKHHDIELRTGLCIRFKCTQISLLFINGDNIKHIDVPKTLQD